MKTRTQQIEELQKEWTQPRWEGITRPYSAEDVVKLRGSVNPECTLAQLGAAKMWRLLHGESKKGYINSLGALTGGQALQQAKAGIEAVYLSGWQVAADANLAASMYPDQSLYPANSVPASSSSCRIWATSSSSSPWQVSTACGSTCLTWQTPMPRARV